MRLGVKAALAATTVLLMGTAAEAAFAQTARTRPTLAAADETGRWSAQAPNKSLQWGGKGRWGVNLNVEEPVGREVKAKDMEAGAFFRIAPSLKVGGSVRLDDKDVRQERRLRPGDRDTRVRLETKFQF
jgi:hypothetical protein